MVNGPLQLFAILCAIIILFNFTRYCSDAVMVCTVGRPIRNIHIITIFLQNVLVKEFWKSVTQKGLSNFGHRSLIKFLVDWINDRWL